MALVHGCWLKWPQSDLKSSACQKPAILVRNQLLRGTRRFSSNCCKNIQHNDFADFLCIERPFLSGRRNPSCRTLVAFESRTVLRLCHGFKASETGGCETSGLPVFINRPRPASRPRQSLGDAHASEPEFE